MGKNNTSSAIIDGLLKFVITGGILSVSIVAPNAISALDKPLQKYFDAMDERARHREWARIIRYMKNTNLVSGNYDHGLAITKQGRKRLEKADFNDIEIQKPKVWDEKWRMVFYDIPEQYKTARNSLAAKMHALGFYQLQKSVWVHPYPCREEIELVTTTYKVERFVTYIETSYIDKQELLKKRFKFL